MNLFGPMFTWNHDRLSTREDMMVKAILTLAYMNALTTRLVQSGNKKPTADDLAHAEKIAIAFASTMFPDLDAKVAG